MEWMNASDGKARDIAAACPWRESFSTGTSWTGLRIVQGTSVPNELAEGYTDTHILGLFAAPTRLSFRIGGERWRRVQLVEHDLMLIPASVPMEENWADPLTTFTVTVNPHVLQTTFGADLAPNTLELRHGCFKPDPLIDELVAALRRDYSEGLLRGRMYGETLGAALAAHLVRAYGTQRVVADTFRGGLSPRHLQLVCDFINEHLEQDLSLSQLATLTGLSTQHFGRAFKQSVGTSPYRYVLLRRLSRARVLLRATELSVLEIAARCGFTNQSAFATAFRRVHGSAPGAFRRVV